MQKQTHTTFLLIIKKRNEHDLYVVCATSKIFWFEKKLMMTKVTFRSLWGVLYHAGLFFLLKNCRPGFCYHFPCFEIIELEQSYRYIKTYAHQKLYFLILLVVFCTLS